jgi:hypothetical protein
MGYNDEVRAANRLIDRWFARWPLRFMLTDDIKVWWRLWSIRLGIAGTAIASAALAFPDWALHTWYALPPEVQQYVPQQYMQVIGVGLFVLSMLSKFIKQHKAGAALAMKKADEIEREKIAIRAQLEHGTSENA